MKIFPQNTDDNERSGLSKMSKEKLSAEARKHLNERKQWDSKVYWNEEEVIRLMISFAKQTAEQLQREKEEAKKLIVGYVEAFASGDSTARMNAIQNAIDFLTPKPEK